LQFRSISQSKYFLLNYDNAFGTQAVATFQHHDNAFGTQAVATFQHHDNVKNLSSNMATFKICANKEIYKLE